MQNPQSHRSRISRNQVPVSGFPHPERIRQAFPLIPDISGNSLPHFFLSFPSLSRNIHQGSPDVSAYEGETDVHAVHGYREAFRSRLLSAPSSLSRH